MMRRCSNWPAKLGAFLKERAARPFDPVANNCALFAADWVELVTKIDPAAKYRALITTPRQVVSLQRSLFILVLALAHEHGMERITPKQAHRGDLCLHDAPRGWAVGICIGRWVAGPGKNGIELVPLSACVAAWRVG